MAKRLMCHCLLISFVVFLVLMGRTRYKGFIWSSIFSSALSKTDMTCNNTTAACVENPDHKSSVQNMSLIKFWPVKLLLPTTVYHATDSEGSDDISVNDVYEQRKKTLREFCKKHNASRLSLNVLVSKRQKVLYCSVPKAACTNWKRMIQVFETGDYKHFYMLNKQDVHKQKFSILSKAFPPALRQRIVQSYYSFIFVRHPYSRLVSAYRNKFEDPYNEIYRRRYGAKILRMFRSNLTDEEYASGKNISFSEFVRWIIHVHKSSTHGNAHYALDEHWNSMVNLCTPCSIQYDFIGKMETLAEDAESLLFDLGVPEEWRFPENLTDKYKTVTERYRNSYFSQLSYEEKQYLEYIYMDDFKAFGYEIPKFRQ